MEKEKEGVALVRINSNALALPDFSDDKSVEIFARRAEHMAQALVCVQSTAIRHMPTKSIMAIDGQPYFTEAGLQFAWGMINMLFGGGGSMSFARIVSDAEPGPLREEIEPHHAGGELGHYRYRTKVVIEHPTIGRVEGFGIASSLDKFLGTNRGKTSRQGKMKTLDAVDENAVMQHSRTRALRSVYEEICRTQNMSWEQLHALGFTEDQIKEAGGNVTFKGGAKAEAAAIDEATGGGDSKPKGRSRSKSPTKKPAAGANLDAKTKGKIIEVSKKFGCSFNDMSAYAESEHGYRGAIFGAPKDVLGKVLQACELAPEAVQAAGEDAGK